MTDKIEWVIAYKITHEITQKPDWKYPMLGIGIKKMRIMMEKKLSKTAIKSVFDMDENKIKILFICHGRSQSMSCLAAFDG